MARRKTRLQRLANLKPAAYAGLRALTAPVPALRHALGFYPEIRPIPEERIEGVAERVDYRIRLAEPRFAEALERLGPNNWDIHRALILDRDPFLVQRFVGFVRDVIVPGHTLTAVDPVSRDQIAFGQRGRSNWNFAHPGPTILRARRVREPAIVVPPFWNLWHLFLEHLLPLIQAARLKAWGQETLVVITGRRRPPLIDAVVTGLKATMGVELRLHEAEPTEHLRVERLLFALNQCWNAERCYALAEAIPDARRVFAAAYADRLAPAEGGRLYITRRNAKLRRVTNEDELAEGLQRRGFRIFQSDWDNHPDQLAAFTAAEVVVGPHGAGLSNIVYSRPGTRILELFPDDHRKTSMLHLAAEHDLEHEPFFGSQEGWNQAFSVDPAQFFARLDRML